MLSSAINNQAENCQCTLGMCKHEEGVHTGDKEQPREASGLDKGPAQSHQAGKQNNDPALLSVSTPVPSLGTPVVASAVSVEHIHTDIHMHRSAEPFPLDLLY